jgi:hypothetical protein
MFGLWRTRARRPRHTSWSSVTFNGSRVEHRREPARPAHSNISCILIYIYKIQVYRAKNESVLHVSLDVEIELSNYSQAAVTALNLAAALVVR